MESSTQSALTLMYSIGIASWCGFLCAARKRKILSPLSMYITGTMVFLTPGAVLGVSPLWDIQEPSAWLALVVILVSVACVGLGQAWSRSEADRSSSDPGAESPIPTWVYAALLILSAGIRVFVDPDNILSRTVTLVERPETVVGKYLGAVSGLPTALACLAPWLWRRTGKPLWLSRGLVAGIAAAGIFSLSRTPFVYVLGTIVIWWLFRSGRVWQSKMRRIGMLMSGVGVVPALVFVTTLIKGSNIVVETLLAEGEIDIPRMYEFVRSWYLEGAISDAYGNFLFILDTYPETYPYMPGLTMGTLATAGMARDLVSWKPWSASYHVTEQILGVGVYERTGTSLATSFVGELWMNGGWVGVALGSVLLGVLGGYLSRVGNSGRSPGYQRVCHAMILVMFVLIPRGDVLSTLLRGLHYVAFAWVAGKAVNCLGRRLSFVARRQGGRYQHWNASGTARGGGFVSAHGKTERS